MSEKNMTIPLGDGEFSGSVHIVGSEASVTSMMEEIRTIIYNRLHIEFVERAIPSGAKPGPCNGCGDH